MYFPFMLNVNQFHPIRFFPSAAISITTTDVAKHLSVYARTDHYFEIKPNSDLLVNNVTIIFISIYTEILCASCFVLQRTQHNTKFDYEFCGLLPFSRSIRNSLNDETNFSIFEFIRKKNGSVSKSNSIATHLANHKTLYHHVIILRQVTRIVS